MVGTMLIVRAATAFAVAVALALVWVVAAKRGRKTVRAHTSPPVPRPAPQAGHPPSSLSTFTGRLTDANRQGVKIEGHPDWLDYGTTFRGSPAERSDIGRRVDVTIVHSLSGPYVRSIRLARDQEPSVVAQTAPAGIPAPALPALPRISGPEGPPAPTPSQLEYASELARKGGLSPDQLNALSLARFGKAFASLNAAEVSRMIVFLGGYPRAQRRRGR